MTTVGFIQVAISGYIFRIPGIAPVIWPPGADGRVGPVTPLDPIAGLQKANAAGGLMGVFITPRTVNRESIRGITDENNLSPAIPRFNKFRGHAMIMISSVRLPMGMAGIKTKVAKTGEQGDIPDRTPLVMPEFRSAWIKHNTINCHTKINVVDEFKESGIFTRLQYRYCPEMKKRTRLLYLGHTVHGSRKPTPRTAARSPNAFARPAATIAAARTRHFLREIEAFMVILLLSLPPHTAAPASARPSDSLVTLRAGPVLESEPAVVNKCRQRGGADARVRSGVFCDGGLF